MTTQVRRVEWTTCMKNRITSVALITAMASATGVFRTTQMMVEIHTVTIVKEHNAQNTPKYIDSGET